ncbi:MAG: hypothetical protein KAX45_09035 [Chitinophagaceae bacterium]|nr:hypothetical protein [Chitinophagaceae bacterium]MBP8244670.1 hypothetical protein [Chitinophagaceae bacterium]
MKYYPIAPGNSWEYRLKDGTVYSNKVLSEEGSLVTMQNSTLPEPARLKIEGGSMFLELMGTDNFQLWLKDEMNAGESWDAAFTANGLSSVLHITVKDTGISKEVEGKLYEDVVMLEAESKINMNGNLISTQYFTQYFYAAGTGLILTTSSAGDYHGLVACTLL